MPTIWNADRVSTLTDAELTILLTNARSRQNELVSSLCIDEINRRKIIAKEARQVSNGKRSGNAIRPRYRNIEIDADNCLVTLAKKLDESYDLTEETARGLSTAPFRAHRLLAKSGKESKIGGVKKRGEVAIYRFISYRINEDVASLAAIMIDKDDESVVWLVGGPDRFLPDQESRQLGSEIGQGVWLAQFSEAEERFRKLVDAIAPAK